MKTNIVVKKNIFLPVLLVLFLSFSNNAGYAVVVEDDNKSAQAQPTRPGLRHMEDELAKSKEPEYAPGEVIIKLKEPEASQEALFAQPYSVTKESHEDILSNLKSKYNLKDEKPVFQGLHNQLKAKNLSLEQLNTQEEAKSSQQAAQKPQDAKQPNLLPIYIVKTDQDVRETCEKLKADPDVEYAEPNYKVEIQMVPNDPFYHSSGSWGQPYDDLWGIKKIQCEQAWDISQGEGVVVAVIDTGVDYNHEDIAQNIWINLAEDINHNGVVDASDFNGMDDDNNGYVDDVRGWDFVTSEDGVEDSDPMDDHGHGTHVSGTIAGIGNNNKGVIGVAPRAKIMGIKGFGASGSAPISDLVNCVIYAADNGAHILSNSWGGFGSSETLTDAFHYAHSKGCVAVAGAGNYNTDTAQFQPANIDTVIAVAATNQNDEKCSFSNYGNEVDVGAPGGDSYSGDGDNYWGRNILSLRSDNNGRPTDMYGYGTCIVGNKYYRARGTSMACPHAAGVAALIMSAHSGITNEEVRARLIAETDPYPQEPTKPLGSGRINAYKAITGAPHPYFKIKDVRLRELNGNGNAIPESNEEAELVVSIENLWTGALTVSATLGTQDPLIKSISKPQTAFGSISQGEIKDNTADPFTINIGDIIHYGAIAKFTLTIQANGTDQTINFPATLGIRKIADVNPYTEFSNPDISELADNQGRISHNIVWDEKFPDAPWDIFVYNLESGDKQKIGQANYLPRPTILENKVAWAANRLGTYGGAEVFLYDLQTHEGNLIPATHSYQIYGHGHGRPIALTKYGLSWIEIGDWFSRTTVPIWFYSFDTNEKYEIGRYLTGYGMPDTSGDKLAWALYDNNSAKSDLFLFDPLTKETRQITNNGRSLWGPSISGDKIVWMEYGESGSRDLCLYNIITGEKRIIKSFTYKDNLSISSIDNYGDKIVYWVVSGNSEFTVDTSLYLHDLATNRTIQIDTYRGQPLSWSPARIWNNIVVWQYNFNIYVADVNATTFPPCPPVFDVVQDITRKEGHLINFRLYATDANGDHLTYSVANLPQGAEFNTDGSFPTFVWIPNFSSVGKTYPVTFSVTDGEFTTDMSVSMTITEGPPLVGTLVSLRDNPDPFNPYGASVSITGVFKEKSDWMLDIVSQDGTTVKSFSELANPSKNISVLWDGLDDSGNIVPDGIYDYSLLGFDFDGGYGYGHGMITVDTTPPIVSNVTVSPNPFQPNLGLLTTISFDISEPSYVSISVHDRQLLINKFKTTLINNIVKWDGKDNYGNYVLPGAYNYVIDVIDKAGNGNSYTGTIMVKYSASEILSLRDSPDPFSPNGDGTYDTTRISARFNQIVRWIFEIKNASSEAVRTFSGVGTSASATWDGKDNSGILLADGTYTYVLTGTNPAENSATQQGTITLKANPPPAPSNLTATPVSSTQLKVTWQDNSLDETGFKVEMSTDGVTFVVKGSAAANITTCTISGLTPNTTYYFRAYSYNIGGKSYSDTISAATLPLPIAPSNLTAQALSSTQLKLTWQDNSADETGFKVEMSTDGTTFVYKAGVGSNVTTCNISGLTANTTYYFRAYAYRGADKSVYSEVVSGTTMPLPLAPSNLSTQALSSTQVKLFWRDNSLDETGFKVEMSSDGVTFAVKGSSAANVATCTIRYLSPNTTYSFRVYAIRGYDKSAYSETIQGTTMPLPIAPSNLTAKALSSTQIKLFWQDNSLDETGFRVEMSTDGVTFAYKGYVGAGITTYTAGGLTTNTTYYFRTYAYRGSDKSGYSNVASGTTQ